MNPILVARGGSPLPPTRYPGSPPPGSIGPVRSFPWMVSPNDAPAVIQATREFVFQTPTASSSVLVTRYPMAIDTAPAIAGNKSTPVSALWHNYLGLLIEAIQAEVGPLNLDIGGVPTSLMDWLGSEIVGARISNWRSQSKLGGGNAAGQVFGLHKRTVSGTATFYAVPQTTTFTAFQGQHPFGKSPTLFASSSAFGHTASAFFTGPAIVRGVVTGFSGGAWNAGYRGNNGLTAGGSPAGSGTFVADLLLVYLLEHA